MNKLIITGNLGSDAASGNYGEQKVINFNVGVNDDYKDQSGNWVSRTIWYNCSFWSQRNIDRLKKGTKVLVTGTPRLTSYVDKNENTKHGIIVTVSELEVLHSTAQTPPSQPSVGQAPQTENQEGSHPQSTPTSPQPKADDDMPF